MSTPEGEQDILKNVSITIPDHKLVVFTGPNGGGKTDVYKRQDYTRVLAIPCDMEIAGYDTDHVNTLRLWQARSPKPIDMNVGFVWRMEKRNRYSG